MIFSVQKSLKFERNITYAIRLHEDNLDCDEYEDEDSPDLDMAVALSRLRSESRQTKKHSFLRMVQSITVKYSPLLFLKKKKISALVLLDFAQALVLSSLET